MSIFFNLMGSTVFIILQHLYLFCNEWKTQLQKSSQIFPVYDVDFLVFLMTAFLKISLCFLMYKIPNRDFPWICCKVEKLENITFISSSFGWGKNMGWIIITFMSNTEGLPCNITLEKGNKSTGGRLTSLWQCYNIPGRRGSLIGTWLFSTVIT